MSFQVIPAIDLLGGRCVRLQQGDYARETAYSDDPVAMARQWVELGAPMLHVVDLDGARAGTPDEVNRRAMAAICEAVSVPVEVSGGMRTLGAVVAALAYGASRIQLGSVAVKDPVLTREAIRRFGEAIVVSIDARDGEVRTDGWLEGSNVRALDLAREMADAGVARIMFTDIGRDGALTEPNFAAYEELVAAVPCPVVASGGVAKVEHLVRLAQIGCEGAIVGKSLYERAFTLPEALAAVATR
ncbi:MAG TPA: 1-(5-phosphoribosyl)-5-[(5-phosphoribosylamino)methylideneamino]imidazole-4-carboxamide isomerase [Tepidiformaceae bacterium]|nr:1-(5-phosphoribosyl)-5-[(5-phosphoribosylamino)methylideneamino]imidazole-4-carboxamide isomerase [Tepidiformaceae bacterium]